MQKYEFITIPRRARPRDDDGIVRGTTTVIRAASHAEAMSQFLAKYTTYPQKGLVPDPEKKEAQR